MITILFDIDGTLIRSGGAGLIAITAAMERLFGVGSLPHVELHGRTDNGILSDVFDAQSLSYDQHRERFDQTYWELLPEILKQCSGEILPGVIDLLDLLSQDSNVALGILTGNSKRAAKIKLEHFGLDGYFHFGGYGDHHSNRNDVARLARESAESFLGERFASEQLWVVGDTVNDILCARSIGSRVVAVETGGCDSETLKSAQPDLQLGSLTNRYAFVSSVIK